MENYKTKPMTKSTIMNINNKSTTTTPKPNPRDYITLKEAEKLGYGKCNTLQYRCIRGSLKARKSAGTWLVCVRDLENWVDKRTVYDDQKYSSNY